MFKCLDPKNLELVKWLAFACKLVDHTRLILMPDTHWMYMVGRFAAPAFWMTFGIGIAQSEKPLMVAIRLVIPAALASLAWHYIDPTHKPNLLIAFALFAMAVQVLKMHKLLGYACFLMLIMVCDNWLEGQWLMPVVILCSYIASSRQNIYWLMFGGLLWATMTHDAGAYIAVAATALLPEFKILVPRIKGLFAWAYPTHLWTLLYLR